MDDAQPGLRAALGVRWRCGVYGEIVQGGELRVGDEAEWEERETLNAECRTLNAER